MELKDKIPINYKINYFGAKGFKICVGERIFGKLPGNMYYEINMHDLTVKIHPTVQFLCLSPSFSILASC